MVEISRHTVPLSPAGRSASQLLFQSFRPAASGRQYVSELSGGRIERTVRCRDARFPAVIPLQARDRNGHGVQRDRLLSKRQGLQLRALRGAEPLDRICGRPEFGGGAGGADARPEMASMNSY
jgi:hypothetical protein